MTPTIGQQYAKRDFGIQTPQSRQTDLHRQVFVRKAATEEYTYLGKGCYEERFSAQQNKIFW